MVSYSEGGWSSSNVGVLNRFMDSALSAYCLVMCVGLMFMFGSSVMILAMVDMFQLLFMLFLLVYLLR